MPRVTETSSFAAWVTPVYGGIIYPEELWSSATPREDTPPGPGLWARLSGWFSGRSAKAPEAGSVPDAG